RGGFMQICKSCGSLMRPEKNNGSVVFVCKNGCAVQKVKKTDSIKLSEKIEHDPLDNIQVIEKNSVNLPVMEMPCPKCDNNKVFWWCRQTRSSDEPETRFYKCIECGHTWREYS
ncbi:MAG: transcription factor S, partial [Candidatus Aenigmarchaeota archaeon]|nr:transcription factor S [Candidatus Aenigmarchaeota archaeon]